METHTADMYVHVSCLVGRVHTGLYTSGMLTEQHSSSLEKVAGTLMFLGELKPGTSPSQ